MIALLGLLALSLNFALWRHGYFRLSAPTEKRCVSFSELLLAFTVYILISYLLPPFLAKWLTLSFFRLTLLQVILPLAALTLFLLLHPLLKVGKLSEVMKWGTSRWREDVGLGLLTYLLALPTTAFINQLAEKLNIYFFGTPGPEQGAVLFLKAAMQNPLILSLALVAILLLAPLLEEALFRTFFQGYIKGYLGRWAAILLSSLAFALMHFTIAQDIGNIPLLLSLFVFALYLGFIYEKQKSLIASVALHMAFNTVTVIRMLSDA